MYIRKRAIKEPDTSTSDFNLFHPILEIDDNDDSDDDDDDDDEIFHLV